MSGHPDWNVLQLEKWIKSISLNSATYQMDSAVHLVQELDGVRIIGNETHELLQKVPGLQLQYVSTDLFR